MAGKCFTLRSYSFNNCVPVAAGSENSDKWGC